MEGSLDLSFNSFPLLEGFIQTAMFGPRFQVGIALLGYLFVRNQAAQFMYDWPQPFDERLALQIGTSSSRSNYGAVLPGGSPFYYLENPRNDLWRLRDAQISPNPCQM